MSPASAAQNLRMSHIIETNNIHARGTTTAITLQDTYIYEWSARDGGPLTRVFVLLWKVARIVRFSSMRVFGVEWRGRAREVVGRTVLRDCALLEFLWSSVRYAGHENFSRAPVNRWMAVRRYRTPPSCKTNYFDTLPSNLIIKIKKAHWIILVQETILVNKKDVGIAFWGQTYVMMIYSVIYQTIRIHQTTAISSFAWSLCSSSFITSLVITLLVIPIISTGGEVYYEPAQIFTIVLFTTGCAHALRRIDDLTSW